MSTTKFPVIPSQEAQDQMRKWNKTFEQELTPCVCMEQTEPKSLIINTDAEQKNLK